MLVYGATGAIGSAAVQIAKHLGAHVVAFATLPHLDLIKSLGADIVIDYNNAPLSTAGLQYDLFFDAVGKRSFKESKPLLKEKGIYISTELGRGLQNPFLALWTPLFKGKRVLFPIPFAKKTDAEMLMYLVKNGMFRPLIERTYDSLDDIAEAYRHVETGQKVGNVVLKIGTPE